MLRLLLGIFSPLVKLLGVSALTEAMDALKSQFDRIEQRQERIEARLDSIERKNDAVFHGWELMSKARAQLPHAPAAEASRPRETIQERARRIARHVEPTPKVANVEGDGDEPPETHV